jgi:hypothetical protein
LFYFRNGYQPIWLTLLQMYFSTNLTLYNLIRIFFLALLVSPCNKDKFRNVLKKLFKAKFSKRLYFYITLHYITLPNLNWLKFTINKLKHISNELNTNIKILAARMSVSESEELSRQICGRVRSLVNITFSGKFPNYSNLF